jgi:hypothetical protein
MADVRCWRVGELYHDTSQSFQVTFIMALLEGNIKQERDYCTGIFMTVPGESF